jgi:hypothetical protein
MSSNDPFVNCSFTDIGIIETLIDCGTRIDDYLEHKFYRNRRIRSYSNSFDSNEERITRRARSSSRKKGSESGRHGLVVDRFHSKIHENTDERYEDDFKESLHRNYLYHQPEAKKSSKSPQRCIELDDPNRSFYGGSVMTSRVTNSCVESRRIPTHSSYLKRSLHSEKCLPRTLFNYLHDELEPSFPNDLNVANKNTYDIKEYQEANIPPGNAGLTLLNTAEGLVIQHIKANSVANDFKMGDVIVALDGIDVSRYPSDVVLQILESKKNFHRSVVFKRYNTNKNNNSYKNSIPRNGLLKRDLYNRMNSSLRSTGQERREV